MEREKKKRKRGNLPFGPEVSTKKEDWYIRQQSHTSKVRKMLKKKKGSGMDRF